MNSPPCLFPQRFKQLLARLWMNFKDYSPGMESRVFQGEFYSSSAIVYLLVQFNK
jgi:hypothetical protein